MTDEDAKKINMHFFQLVVSLQAAAWQQMGKIASPVTGKVERNLDQAKASIDMLEMLSEKTKGNLSNEENQLLSNALYELKMNFVDESSKPESKTPEEDTDKPKQAESAESNEDVPEDKADPPSGKDKDKK